MKKTLALDLQEGKWFVVNQWTEFGAFDMAPIQETLSGPFKNKAAAQKDLDARAKRKLNRILRKVMKESGL